MSAAYYSLRYEFEIDDNSGYYDVDDGLDFAGVRSWALGVPFEGTPPNPIVVTISALEGFTGGLPEMMDGNMCLMTRRMVDVLRQTGVDNLDVYPAILRDEENDRSFEYYGVNILGLVAAADLKKSEWVNFDGEPRLDTHFDKLVVDKGAARGQLLFRLAESTGTIIIHQRVKDALVAAGFTSLRYVPAS